MSTSLKGTRTEKNILIAFAGESQARNRYTFFAKQARKEGFVQISEIFAETAEHEKAHASTLFKMLEGGDVEFTASFPAGKTGTTEENLRASALGEHHEYEEMYPEFAKIAKEEGFPEIAGKFMAIAKAEKEHERRFLVLAANIAEGKVFKRAEKTTWRCRNCGYAHHGEKAIEVCPACAHGQAHFEIAPENW